MIRMNLGLLLALPSFLAILFAQARIARETQPGGEARMKWWTESRFGMFIHWGLYALPARHEWVKQREGMTDKEYQKYFDHFDPDLFDASEWARTAKKAGMKYVVVTAKHHDGFCLWDSKYTDYKVTRTPCGKDLLQPLVRAFRAEGLRVGFYYSLLDWHHPDYSIDKFHPRFSDPAFRRKAKNRDMKKYADYLRHQVRELLTEFSPVDSLFLDFSFPGESGKGRREWQSAKLLKMIRRLQPHIIINDRLDLLNVPGGWDYRTPEQFMPRAWIVVNGKRVPWETCQTFSGSWGYHRDEASWKSVRQLVVLLVEAVSKGGNFLLNVGPTARGTFDRRAAERLEGIGEWMKYHGRSVYGCTQAPAGLNTPRNCLLTYHSGTGRLYVHVLEWPAGALHLDGYAGRVEYAQLLHDASEIKFIDSDRSSEIGFMPGERQEAGAAGLILRLPVRKPNVTVPVVELFLHQGR
jgi:alpha-L-fucosidase